MSHCKMYGKACLDIMIYSELTSMANCHYYYKMIVTLFLIFIMYICLDTHLEIKHNTYIFAYFFTNIKIINVPRKPISFPFQHFRR